MPNYHISIIPANLAEEKKESITFLHIEKVFVILQAVLYNSAMEPAKLNLPPATGNLRALQLSMLNILKAIDKLCTENNIRYWIDFGTLLGAVRHGGFIPWDDDMDISVHSDDYDRFLQLCLTELPDNLILQTKQTDPECTMGEGLVKIRDRRTLYIHDFETFRINDEKGAFVDIFKSIAYPKMNSSVFRFLARRVSFAYGFFHYPRTLNLKNIVCYFVYPVSYVWHKALFSILSSFGKKTTRYVSLERYCYGTPINQAHIFPLQRIAFEDGEYNCPNNPDAYLKHLYGDYMQLPSPEQRRIHARYFAADINLVKLQ